MSSSCQSGCGPISSAITQRGSYRDESGYRSGLTSALIADTGGAYGGDAGSAAARRVGNDVVKPRLDVITLAVADLEAALAFYRRLGFQSNGIVGTEWTDELTGANGAIAIFELEGGLLLNLYPRAELAKDAAIPAGSPQSGEFSLAQLVRSRDEVDEVLKNAAAAGATVTPAHERPWGIYSGYFRDPDGHLWEVIWNPRPRG
jgi:predicted lactoylglutathione lyase